MQITTENIYEKICEVTTEEERGHWQSDLYCKATPAVCEIIKNYEYSSQCELFTNNIDHTLWYDIPFIYPLKRGEV